jgi:hypothetical protein
MDKPSVRFDYLVNDTADTFERQFDALLLQLYSDVKKQLDRRADVYKAVKSILDDAFRRLLRVQESGDHNHEFLFSAIDELARLRRQAEEVATSVEASATREFDEIPVQVEVGEMPDFTLSFNDLRVHIEGRGLPVRVTPEARGILIERAQPYKQRVEQELSEGSITGEFLQNSLATVLGNAFLIALEQNEDTIDERVIGKSMGRYCPYLFWC